MPEIELKGDPEDFKAMEPLGNAPVAPAHGIAAIALNFALKYHDINTVQDGVLYQQYKMEGKNMHGLHLDHVFETAIQIEKHLMMSSQRIAGIVIDAISDGVDEAEEIADADAPPAEPTPKAAG